MKNNSLIVLTAFLRSLKVPVTVTSLSQELEKHPDRSSLKAISDLLSYWRVRNHAYKVDLETLKGLPKPSIVHLSSNNGEFGMLSDINETGAYFADENLSISKITLEEFKNIFKGSVLIASDSSAAGESDYQLKKTKELIEALRYPVIIVATMLLVLLGVVEHRTFGKQLNFSLAFILLGKTAGLTICIVLLGNGVDASLSLIKKICTGEINDCNSILSSDSAQVNSFLSWAEVGFFYFAGSWLALLFNTGSAPYLKLLTYLNLCCLPYSFYSIYFQAFIAKKWCVLCTTVQVLLWSEFLFFLPYCTGKIDCLLAWGDLNNLLICFSVPVLGWAFLKPFFRRSSLAVLSQRQLNTFKYNATLFDQALKEQPRLELLSETCTLILGNPNARNIITVVTNPFCRPCAQLHKLLDDWLDGCDTFKVQLVFAGSGKVEDPRSKVAQHLHCLQLENESLVREAISSWYSKNYGDYEAWSKVYPLMEKNDVSTKIAEQRDWNERFNITATPTVFLNGHSIPAPWDHRDIKYFI